MSERTGARISKANIEAAAQGTSARRRFSDVSSMIGNTMRIVTEPLFDFGKETEPYTEKDVDTLMSQEWGITKKRMQRRNF